MREKAKGSGGGRYLKIWAVDAKPEHGPSDYLTPHCLDLRYPRYADVRTNELESRPANGSDIKNDDMLQIV